MTLGTLKHWVTSNSLAIELLWAHMYEAILVKDSSFPEQVVLQQLQYNALVNDILLEYRSQRDVSNEPSTTLAWSSAPTEKQKIVKLFPFMVSGTLTHGTNGI